MQENQIDHDIVEGVRTFVQKEVMPVASELEHRNEYPKSVR